MAYIQNDPTELPRFFRNIGKLNQRTLRGICICEYRKWVDHADYLFIVRQVETFCHGNGMTSTTSANERKEKIYKKYVKEASKSMEGRI